MSDLDNPEAEHVSSTMEQDFEAKTGSTAKEEELVNCIDGRYELKQQLGTGGYGTVFEAFDQLLNRSVAVKFLERRCASGVARDRFLKEAQAGASLSHENIVCVRDIKVDDSRQYIVMDLIHGCSLSQVLEREGALSETRIVDLALQISNGLLHAHQQGILHRDIKPSNVMVELLANGQEHARIVDFGIARLLDHEGNRLTQTGETVGTPYYMSPAQAMGQTTDERSDIYSFGCLLYELTNGSPPFSGDNHLAVMTQHVMKEPGLVQRIGINRSLVELVMRCLEKTPKDRYQSFSEIIFELNQIKEGKRISPRRSYQTGMVPLAVLSLLMTGVVMFVAIRSLHEYLAPSSSMPQDKSRAPVQRAQQQVPQQLQARWDELDVTGQQLLNDQQYDGALETFQKSLEARGLTKEQTLVSLEKVALVHHMMQHPKEEKSIDERIRKLILSNEERNSNADMLKRALALVSDEVKETHRSALDSLGAEVLAEVRRALAANELESAGNLIDVALPRFEHLLGINALLCVRMRTLNAERFLLLEEPREALKVSEQCLRTLRGNVPNTDLDLNLNLVRLCKIYNEDSEPLKAETSAKLVLTNLPARGANTEMNNLIFEARLQLARSLYLQRNEKQALARYQECLKAAEGTGNVFLLEESLKGIATIYESSNEFQSTEKLFVRLMNTSADPLKHAAYTFMLAKLYLQQNRPLEAQGGVALLRECLSIRQHLLPPRDSAVRETFRLLILGEVCRRTRAIQVNPELDGLARQYVAITERTPSAGPDERAEALSMMACVVYRNGGFDQSKACIEKLLLIAKHHHTVTDAFGQWFYDTAKEVYPESLARVQSIFEERVRSAHEPANSIAYAQFLDDVARVARERGDHKTALKNQSLAKDIVLKHPPDTLWATDRWRGAMIIGNYARSVALGEASKYYALEKQYRSEE